MSANSFWRHLWSWPALVIPAAVVLGAQGLAPGAAQAQFPDLPCVRGAATFLFRLTYGAAGIPVALGLTLLIGAARLFRERGRKGRAWAAGLLALALTAAYLVGLGSWSLLDTPPRVACAGMDGTAYRAVRCWENLSTFEMNVVPRQAVRSPDDLAAVGQDLRRHRRDKFLFEAFVFAEDSPRLNRSNAELFILARPQLSLFGRVCQTEREEAQARTAADRLAYYRFSDQQRPVIDAYFVPRKTAPAGPLQFVATDYAHQLQLDFRSPPDLDAAERAYIDRVRTATELLNADLDAETAAAGAARAAALRRMRADWSAQGSSLEQGVPARLLPFAASRVRRFFANYELLLLSEEERLQPSAAGSPEARIHTGAFKEHRLYFFQEPRVVEPIAFLYINSYPSAYSDDVLGVVSWAIF